MTTKPTVNSAVAPGFIVLPDPPEPEDMNNFIDLHLPGNSHYLAEHLGNPETTLIIGEAYICSEPTRNARGLLYPDMLIAFNVNPELSRRRNGTSSRTRASRRTSCWKSPRKAPAGAM